MTFPPGAQLALSPLVGGVSVPPANHIGGPLAGIRLENGRAMTEADAAGAPVAAGRFQGEFRAQAPALARDGFLVAGEDGRLRPVNCGDCK